MNEKKARIATLIQTDFRIRNIIRDKEEHDKITMTSIVIKTILNEYVECQNI
jgi:hypothetical protein